MAAHGDRLRYFGESIILGTALLVPLSSVAEPALEFPLPVAISADDEDRGRILGYLQLGHDLVLEDDTSDRMIVRTLEELEQALHEAQRRGMHDRELTDLLGEALVNTTVTPEDFQRIDLTVEPFQVVTRKHIKDLEQQAGIDLQELMDIYGIVFEERSFEECDAAAAAFVRGMEQARSSGLSPAHAKSFFRAARAYDELCLAGKFHWRGDGRMTSGQPPAFIRDLGGDRVAGVLVASPPGRPDYVFCGATFVHASLAVTARHCFFDAVTGSPKEEAVLLEYGRVRAYQLNLDRPILEVELASQPLEWDASRPISHSEDFLILSLATSVPDLPTMLFDDSDADPSAPAWLHGYFEYMDLGYFLLSRGRLLESGQLHRDAPQWVTGLRWSAGLPCLQVGASNSCRLHTCQSVGRYSGSPLVGVRQTRAGRQLVLLGLHVGAAASRVNEDCESAGDAMGIGNIAVSGDYLEPFIEGALAKLQEN